MIVAVATLVASQAFAAAETNEDKIRARIAPVGEVCVGAECGGAVVAASSGPRSGEEVYGGACIACHGAGVLGAPKKGDTAAWDARLEKGFDATLNNAIHGLNSMPPKGNCLNCSDDELLAAIKFMSGRE
nr:c-type cytochrome [Oceanobacter mangrovi]